MIKNWKTQFQNKVLLSQTSVFSIQYSGLDPESCFFSLSLSFFFFFFLLSYLTEQYQCTRIDNVFSDCKSITAAVPAGSILGLFLFIHLLSVIFNLCNYTDVSTLYKADKSISALLPLQNLGKKFNLHQTHCAT